MSELHPDEPSIHNPSSQVAQTGHLDLSVVLLFRGQFFATLYLLAESHTCVCTTLSELQAQAPNLQYSLPACRSHRSEDSIWPRLLISSLSSISSAAVVPDLISLQSHTCIPHNALGSADPGLAPMSGLYQRAPPCSNHQEDPGCLYRTHGQIYA